ncbi:lanthionine synthetase C family protein [Nocardia brasiliensis]
MNADRASVIVDELHPAGRPWRSLLPADLAASAIAVSVEVGKRLRDTASTPESGSAGCAVLFDQLDRLGPDHGWAVHSHACLTAAARTAEQAERGRLGLFGGLCEVAFAADALSRNGTRYQRLLDDLDDVIARAAAALGTTIAAQPTGLPSAAFDVIAGLAGAGAYLLRRTGRAQVDDALYEVLAGLTALCGTIDGVPNWHTLPTALVPNSPMARAYPTGVFNCGLAHGVPGPLAVLALAASAGISVPGQRAAVARVAHWLVAQRRDDAWGPNWPTGVALPDSTGTAPTAYGPTHNAWCYGSPGVARALWSASAALADPQLGELAVATMRAVYRRTPDARRIDGSPGLCHGVAGLLQITVRFAADTGDPDCVAAVPVLTAQLLSMFQPERRYGYVSIAENGPTADDPGLLDGAAGVALALLAAATDLPPMWDRTLLLS